MAELDGRGIIGILGNGRGGLEGGHYTALPEQPAGWSFERDGRPDTGLPPLKKGLQLVNLVGTISSNFAGT
jgi:hypothetical protein